MPLLLEVLAQAAAARHLLALAPMALRVLHQYLEPLQPQREVGTGRAVNLLQMAQAVRVDLVMFRGQTHLRLVPLQAAVAAAAVAVVWLVQQFLLGLAQEVAVGLMAV